MAQIWQNLEDKVQSDFPQVEFKAPWKYAGISMSQRLVRKAKGLLTTDTQWRSQEKYGYITSALKGSESLQSAIQGLGPESADHECAKLTQKVIDLINHPSEDLTERDRYKKIASLTAKALEADGYDKDKSYGKCLHEVCYVLFTKVDTQGFTADVTEKMARKGGYERSSHPPSDSLERLEEVVNQSETFNEAVEKADSKAKIDLPSKVLSSVRGDFALQDFDPLISGGNPPNIKFQLSKSEGDKKPVTCIRMPSPTKGNQVNPLFKGYLRALEQKGEKHTMVSLQNRKGYHRRAAMDRVKGAVGFAHEMRRARALENLGRDPEFENVITVFTLDKNSKFYSQEDRPESQNAEAFKADFMNRLFAVQGGAFRLPEDWKEGEKKEKLIRAINGVHSAVFDSSRDLTREQIRDFIEITYDIFVDIWVDDTDCNFYNESCKDCIDRGAGANYLKAAVKLLSELRRAKTPEQKKAVNEKIDGLLLKMDEDALWARKRGALPERIERAKSAVLCLTKLAREKPEKFAELEELYRFDTVSFTTNGQKSEDSVLGDSLPTKASRGFVKARPTKSSTGTPTSFEQARRRSDQAETELRTSLSQARRRVENLGNIKVNLDIGSERESLDEIEVDVDPPP